MLSRVTILGSVCLSFLAITGCDLEPEPRTWQAEGYVAGDKPDGVEYLYCDYPGVILEVYPAELTAYAYEYDTTETFATNRQDYEKLPTANFIENVTELKKSRPEASIYKTSEVAWSGIIQGCGNEYLWSDVSFGVNDTGEKLVFSRKFRKLNLIDTLECKGSQDMLQKQLESKAKLENSKWWPSGGSCVFMPDTQSFEAERGLFQEEARNRAVEFKQKSLNGIEAKERQEADLKQRKEQTAEGRI